MSTQVLTKPSAKGQPLHSAQAHPVAPLLIPIIGTMVLGTVFQKQQLLPVQQITLYP